MDTTLVGFSIKDFKYTKILLTKISSLGPLHANNIQFFTAECYIGL